MAWQKVTYKFENLHQFLEDKEQSLLLQMRDIDETILRNQHENVNIVLKEREISPQPATLGQ